MPGFPEPHRWRQECLECAARMGYAESYKTLVLQRERLSQKLKKGEKEEGRRRKEEEGKRRGRKKKGDMGRVKGMCLTW